MKNTFTFRRLVFFGICFLAFFILSSCGSSVDNYADTLKDEQDPEQVESDKLVAEALPDFESLKLSLEDEGGIQAQGLNSNKKETEEAVVEKSVFFEYLKLVMDNTNVFVEPFLEYINTLSKTPSNKKQKNKALGKNQKEWGPIEIDAVSLKLTASATTGKTTYYSFRFDGYKGSEDSAITLIQGNIDTAKTKNKHQGIGVIKINFDNFKKLFSDVTAEGMMTIIFDTAGEDLKEKRTFHIVRQLLFRMDNFSEDPGSKKKAKKLVYSFKKFDKRGGAFKFLFNSNLEYLPDIESSTTTETILTHARWTKNLAGRVDALIYGGDVTGNPFIFNECWDKTGTIKYKTIKRDDEYFEDYGSEKSCPARMRIEHLPSPSDSETFADVEDDMSITDDESE